MIHTEDLKEFIRESWRIEGLELSDDELQVVQEVHEDILEKTELPDSDLINAALTFTNGYGKLRKNYGNNVRVGNHHPPRGGPEVSYRLQAIVKDSYSLMPHSTPYQIHQAFEALHPFMDGNGRTGRLLWLWMMEQRGETIHHGLGFLHTWYYQSLDNGR